MTKEDMLHKSVAINGFKTIDEEQGIVEAFVAGIGNRDSVNDIIEPGAFESSLTKRLPKGVWSHDWTRPVSKTLEIYEVPAGDDRLPEKMKDAGIGGLYVKTQFNLETEDGRNALSWVKFYNEGSEWSIGYQVPPGGQEYDKKMKANRLKTIDLFEFSPVLFGANPLTSTVGVKVDGGGCDIHVQGANEVMSKKIEDAVKQIMESETDDVVVDEVVVDAPVVEPDEVKDADAVEPDEVDNTVDPEGETVVDVEPEGEAKTADEPVVEPSVAFAAVKSLLETNKVSEAEAIQLGELAMSAVDPDGVKVLQGSYEARRRDIEKEIEKQTSGGWVWIAATFDDTVVYEQYDRNVEEYKFFEVAYSLTSNGVELGEPREVDVVEVAIAKHAFIDLVFKGRVKEAKSFMKPFLDGSFSDVEADEKITDAIEQFKVGASLSASNRGKLEDVYSLLGDLLGVQATADETPVEVVDAEVDGEKDAEVVVKDETEVTDNESGLTALSADDLAELESLLS